MNTIEQAEEISNALVIGGYAILAILTCIVLAAGLWALFHGPTIRSNAKLTSSQQATRWAATTKSIRRVL